jgi:hypothetical protein
VVLLVSIDSSLQTGTPSTVVRCVHEDRVGRRRLGTALSTVA